MLYGVAGGDPLTVVAVVGVVGVIALAACYPPEARITARADRRAAGGLRRHSPEARDAAGVERRLVAHKRDIVELGLRDQHAIERIAMDAGETAGTLRVEHA